MMATKVLRVLFAITVVTAVYGYAASLNLDVASLGAFALGGKSCQGTRLATNIVYHGQDEDPPAPTTMDYVEVTGISGSCHSADTLQVAVANGGTLTAEAAVIVNATGGTQQVPAGSFIGATVDYNGGANVAHAIIPKSR